MLRGRVEVAASDRRHREQPQRLLPVGAYFQEIDALRLGLGVGSWLDHERRRLDGGRVDRLEVVQVELLRQALEEGVRRRVVEEEAAEQLGRHVDANRQDDDDDFSDGAGLDVLEEDERRERLDGDDVA